VKSVGYLVLSLLAMSANAYAGSQPNILLIYVDDLGYGDLGSYGHAVIQTPNIDKLAADGMSFTSNYSPSALCSPSRAGLMTGRTPYRTGIQSWISHDSGVFLRDEEITLAELLSGEGYETVHIGKWHLNSDLGSDTEPQPTEQGFDYYYGHNAFQIPTNHNPTNVYRGKTLLPQQSGYTADIYANEAIRWLENRNESAPFFMYLAMAEPHTSFANPPEYNAMYESYTRGDVVAIPNGQKDPPKEMLVPRGPGEYYANITYMDAQIGRVLQWLDAHDVYDETVVVFSSDNGPVTSQWINWWEVNAHGSTGGFKGRKHFLYEGGIRVPAIIRFANTVEPGSVSDAPIVGMDWFVTLANIGGAEVPTDRSIDGIDISPLFAGKKLPKRTLFWALSPDDRGITDIEYAVRVDSWKLMLDARRNPLELYNLDEDPMEFFNLIDSRPLLVDHLLGEAVAILDSIDNDSLRPQH
jgi:arylsulfatase A-like enzyme